MSSTQRTCLDCPKPITAKNKSGRCRVCHIRSLGRDPVIAEKRNRAAAAALQRPEVKARQGAAISAWRRHKLATDPAFAAFFRDHGRELGRSNIGNLAQPKGSEPRRRAGRTQIDNKLAWCPPEYRDIYRRELRRFGKSAPARAITMERVQSDRLKALATFDNLNSAMDYLRRYTPVFKREEGYAYGTVILSPEKLIERALQRGWKPLEDRWAA